MATKVKEYIVKVPFNIHDWRKGQRYVIAKYTTDEITILDMKQRKEGNKLINESHKILNMAKKVPSVIAKVLNSKSLLVEEFSVNVDEIQIKSKGETTNLLVTEKKLDEKEGLLDEMKITTVQEMEKGDNLSTSNLLEEKLKDINIQTRDETNKSEENSEEYSTLSSICDTSYINQYYDINTFSLTVKTKVCTEYKENIFEQEGVTSTLIDYTDGQPGIYVYKLVTVTINSMLLGWICDHVKKTMKNMLLKFQKKLIETKGDWIDLKEKDILEMEKKMIAMFMKSE